MVKLAVLLLFWMPEIVKEGEEGRRVGAVESGIVMVGRGVKGAMEKPEFGGGGVLVLLLTMGREDAEDEAEPAMASVLATVSARIVVLSEEVSGRDAVTMIVTMPVLVHVVVVVVSISGGE